MHRAARSPLARLRKKEGLEAAVQVVQVVAAVQVVQVVAPVEETTVTRTR